MVRIGDKLKKLKEFSKKYLIGFMLGLISGSIGICPNLFSV